MTDTLGSRIKYLRNKNGLTQEQLAKAIKASTYSISSWESDRIRPRTINRLASFFKVPMWWIFQGGELPAVFDSVNCRNDPAAIIKQLYRTLAKRAIVELTRAGVEPTPQELTQFSKELSAKTDLEIKRLLKLESCRVKD